MRPTRSYYLSVLLLGFAMATASFGHEGYQPTRDAYRLQKIQKLNQNLERISAKKPSSSPTSGGVLASWQPAQPQNEIDAFTFQKMAEDDVPINALCDDGSFLRRVSLLLIGRLPEPEQVRSFYKNKDPNSRAQFIDSLLASEAFNTHWSFWFQEYFESTTRLLRAGLPYYNAYLAEAVATAKPLDKMAEELLTTTGLTDQVAEANFFARANEMVRLPQDFWDNIAIHANSKFLGMSVQCISCHDGAYHLEEVNLYLADKKREDLWALAAFFSGVNRRAGTVQNNQARSFNIFERPSAGYEAESTAGDRPTRNGGLIQPKYLYSGQQPGQDQNYLQAFASYLTADRQFARNFANRFWGHIFGLALVEPMDNFDPYRLDPERSLPEGWEHQALDLNLLEHATDKMIEFQFDLRQYLRYLLNSATFQMSSEFPPGNWKETYTPYYTRYLARHMPAETVYDAIVSATGVIVPMPQAIYGDRENLVIADYAHELMDPAFPRGARLQDVSTFLQAFGRGNRYDLPRTNDGDIGQALALMNSSVINQRLIAPESRIIQYANQDLSGEEIIRELYLDVYCREPSNAEMASLIGELLNFETTEERATTVMWLLLNKAEFTFIY